MLITSVLSVGGPAFVAATGALDVCFVVVDEISVLISSAADGLVKWMVKSAGPDWSFVRFTVMGTAGLWYFNRGRQLRQNFLGP